MSPQNSPYPEIHSPRRFFPVIATVLSACCLLPVAAQQRPNPYKTAPLQPLNKSASRNIPTRDPSDIVKCKNDYWVFYTGRGIRSYHSRNLVKWEPGPPVFKTPPEWVAQAVPNNQDMIYWAPDVMKVGNLYWLYYSVSSLGSMHSAIGLVTNPTLDPADPAFHWTDHGPVVQSSRESGDFNAIDPTIFRDDDGKMWLVFGSYWSGIKLIQIDPRTGKRLAPDSPMYSLAYNDSIEAAYLYKKNGYYYLFVNWGSCCRGPASTYNIRVGRSQKITGPYIDKAGHDMMQKGGTVFMATKIGPLTGPGHAGVLLENGRSWLTSHFEGDDRLDGKPTLGISPLRWGADGWPVADVPDK